MAPNLISTVILIFIFFVGTKGADDVAAGGGSWELLQPNIGITAMHMQLLHNDRVVIYDRTDFGTSNISLPDNKCRQDPNEVVLKVDCMAHSIEYNVISNTFRPLTVQTDVWCSSGAVMPDGSFVQAGGFNDGDRVVRVFDPCEDSDCDWVEIGSGLAARRWYATSHVIPGGRQIIVGGRRQFNYEFYPKTAADGGVWKLPFLAETYDRQIENNLYPFVFLLPDGSLFIYSNNRAISLDYIKHRVVRTYPVMPGGHPRSYPSTGSAVLLPLRNIDGVNIRAEVLVCGGAPIGSFEKVRKGVFVEALNTCGRIKVTDPNPQWVIESMPLGRTMGDMLLLPDGNVLIINGASSGTAGWEYGRDPVLHPVIYKPDASIDSRFEIQTSTNVPRMYHSTAVLLRDGRVLLGGSNPHIGYEFQNVLFPTELRLEAFSPEFLNASYNHLRPRIISTASQFPVEHGKQFVIRFKVSGRIDLSKIQATLIAPSFTSHSFAMNHRLLELGFRKVEFVANLTYQIRVKAPSTECLAPAGYYILFVVHQGIPSEGIWIQIQQS